MLQCSNPGDKDILFPCGHVVAGSIPVKVIRYRTLQQSPWDQMFSFSLVRIGKNLSFILEPSVEQYRHSSKGAYLQLCPLRVRNFPGRESNRRQVSGTLVG
uniref:Uncharacterized protein n=1 Tax=Cacopsylla melanoneura TaxID=428564 RepID=A0A8D8US41_9HEMI